MRSIAEAVAWAEKMVGKPAPGGPGHCLEDVRTAYGTGPWATSAKLFFEKVPHDQMHVEKDITKIPVGALIMYPNLSQFGHITLSVGHGICITNDYVEKGKMGRAPADLPRWGIKPPLHWTFWTPYGVAK